MDSLTTQEFNEVVEKLNQSTLTMEVWTTVLPVLDYDQLKQLIILFHTKMAEKPDQMKKYLDKLVYYNQDEDRLTEVLELLISEATDKILESAWFRELSTSIVTWLSSDIVLENFFLFLGQLDSHYPLQPESQFLQDLDKSESAKVRFRILCFRLERNHRMYENTEILQLFYSVPQDQQLQFIPILNNVQKTQRLELAKEILLHEESQHNHYIILSILFQMTKDISKLFNSYEIFEDFIFSLKNTETYELLFAEFTKPDAITLPWIQKLLLKALQNSPLLSDYIISTSGEYLSEWPEQFREQFLQLILNGNEEVQISLAKILSPLWHDEQIIQNLLKQQNKHIQEPLYESLVSIYQLLTPELQQTVEKQLRSDPKNAYFEGLLVATNITHESFLEDIRETITDYSNIEKEKKIRGILVGLGMKWNTLPVELKEFIKTMHKNFPKKFKKELLKGLEMIYVTLDVEGMNFVTELQSYDFQISPDEIELD